MFKKSFSTILIVILLFTISGCATSKKVKYIDEAETFVETIHESYINMLKVEATILTAKIKKVDTSNPKDLYEYQELLSNAISEAQKESKKYLTTIKNNRKSISELYDKLSNFPDEYKAIKEEADIMYECYQYMLSCVTDDIMSYLSWSDNFIDTAEKYDKSYEQIKELLD